MNMQRFILTKLFTRLQKLQLENKNWNVIIHYCDRSMCKYQFIFLFSKKIHSVIKHIITFFLHYSAIVISYLIYLLFIAMTVYTKFNNKLSSLCFFSSIIVIISCSSWLLLKTTLLEGMLKNDLLGASLVVQWLRIRLPMQGTRVRALVREDPTCHGATGPVSHNYWACASGACAPQQERPR